MMEVLVMKAIVKDQGQKNISLKDVPVPEVDPNEVLIKVHFAGICGTDISIWKGKFPHPTPIILGHEFSGEIVETGNNVQNWEEGDRVVSELHASSCATCDFCREGELRACAFKKAPGIADDGAFAEYMKLPVNILHELPDNITMKEAAVIEPAAFCSSVLNNVGIEAGDVVVILGTGPIGLILSRLANLKGASKTIVTGIDRDEEIRLPFAEKIGNDYVINSCKKDIFELIKDVTDGKGADVVLDAAGVQETINQAFELVKWNGRIGGVGVPENESLEVKWTKGVFKALDVKFNYSSSFADWRRIIKLLNADKLELSNFISKTYKIEDYKEAFHKAAKGEAIKLVFNLHSK